jgi:hypothetical protein
MTVRHLLAAADSLELTKWMALMEAEATERREQDTPRQQRGL